MSIRRAWEELRRLAAQDPDPEVRQVAEEACARLRLKMKYFGQDDPSSEAAPDHLAEAPRAGRATGDPPSVKS